MNNFYKFLILSLFISGWSVYAQELVIGDAANLIVSPDAELVFANGMNLVNNSSTGTFDGNLTFKGPLPQLIGGDFPLNIAKLSIQDGADLSLNVNLVIYQELNLTSGFLFLNDHNLRLNDGASVSGDLSETSMVVAEGNGKMEMGINGNGNYLFPIGDTIGVDEYTPAEFNFASGTYDNAVLSVNVKNMKHPNNSSTTNYLNRYWTVNQDGMSDFSCDIELNYTNEDVYGAESEMVGAAWNGSYWTPLNDLALNQITGTVGSFSQFTGGEKSVLSIVEVVEEDVEVFINGDKIIIEAGSSFPIEKIELFNKLGQFIKVIKPANALHHEFSLNQKSDIYLLRLSSGPKTVSKKIALF
jgi:trimeric autotransporter adhesin